MVVKEMLKKAIEMEEKGYKFYIDSAKKAEDSVTKKTFEFLAKNEIQHIKIIKAFYKNMAKEDIFPDLTPGDIQDQVSEDIMIFARSIKDLKEKIKPSETDKEALEFAIEFENFGYSYYQKFLKESKDKNLIELLSFLLKEEDRHCKALMNIHTYITDSANWYMYEEGSFPQG
jgi:rubrerythrin